MGLLLLQAAFNLGVNAQRTAIVDSIKIGATWYKAANILTPTQANALYGKLSGNNVFTGSNNFSTLGSDELRITVGGGSYAYFTGNYNVTLPSMDVILYRGTSSNFVHYKQGKLAVSNVPTLSSAATKYLTTDANGIVSSRTAAEVKSDIGATTTTYVDSVKNTQTLQAVSSLGNSTTNGISLGTSTTPGTYQLTQYVTGASFAGLEYIVDKTSNNSYGEWYRSVDHRSNFTGGYATGTSYNVVRYNRKTGSLSWPMNIWQDTLTGKQGISFNKDADTSTILLNSTTRNGEQGVVISNNNASATSLYVVGGTTFLNTGLYINKNALPIATGKKWPLKIDTLTNQIVRDTSGGGGVAGTDGMVQYNSSGALAGTSNFKFNNTNSSLNIGGYGSQNSPTYSFGSGVTNGATTGMYYYTTNTLGFAAAGAVAMTIDASNNLTLGQWGSPSTVKAASAGVGNTNRAGINLALGAGQSTGNGAGGNILFQTTAAGSSGTSGNSYSTNFTIKSTGILNIATIQTYADNTAALAGGLVVGDVYKTVLGVLMIVY